MRQVNDEVLFATNWAVDVQREDIEFLKQRVALNARNRVRFCAHQDIQDQLHEMFIVHTSDTYVRPHKHLKKAVSHHIIEGSVDLVLFDDDGNITTVIPMGDYSSGKKFYQRTSVPCYYTLLIRSNIAVFHEAASGPFRRPETLYAPWSPDEDDIAATVDYMQQLAIAVGLFNSGGYRADSDTDGIRI